MTAQHQWRFLTIKDFQGNIWVDTKIPFGGVAGCGAFGWLADARKEIIIALFNVHQIFRWVDDNMFVKFEDEPLEMKDILQVSVSMGVQFNDKKFVDWKTKQKYLGPSRKCSKEEIKKIFGQLIHMTYILPTMKSYLWNLYWFDKSWFNHSALRDVQKEVATELYEWQVSLELFNRFFLMPEMEPIDISWVGDASTGYGIGVLIGDRWASFKLLKKENLCFIVYTDNTTTKGVITNQKSRHCLVNEEWRLIQKELTALKCLIVAKRVTSGENNADKLSRGVDVKHDSKLEVVFNIPLDLRTRVILMVGRFVIPVGCRVIDWKDNEVKQQMMSGSWSQATMENYSMAMSKLEKFGAAKGLSRLTLLPSSQEIGRAHV